MSNSIGRVFQVTSFGESHGRCIGVVIDGCPAGLPLTEADIQSQVDKRRPQPRSGQTARAEEDRVEILSGVFQGFSTGAPLCLIVWNKDTDSSQYERIKYTPRPGHADYTAFVRYGGFNDYRGGGRFSGRVTLAMVMAGAVSRKLLNTLGVEILAHTVQIGKIKTAEVTTNEIRSNVYANAYRCADVNAIEKFEKVILQAGSQGDSIGGVIEGMALNVPAGLGEPWFDSLESEMSKALFSIPAVKGIEFGSGFASVEVSGSENNDAFIMKNRNILTITNHSGGILGGITDGMPLSLKVAVKPTPSISKKQITVNLKTLENAEIEIKGRHDVCLVPRAVVVVEAAMAITLSDFVLRAGLLPRILK